ncbi:hypothetical protein GW17_00054926 [Ensete ventricosum]|nr:hypothetical protein GW17_00054926 [Ensete ventricosum]
MEPFIPSDAVCLLLRHAVMNGARMAQQKPKRQRSYIPLPKAVLRKVLHSPARWGEKKNAGTRMGGGLLFLFPSLHGSHTTGFLPPEKDVASDVESVMRGPEEASLGEAHAVEALLPFPSAGEWLFGHALLREQATVTLPLLEQQRTYQCYERE